MSISRRSLLKSAGTLGAASILPISLVELAYGKDQSFTFAYISDSHLNQIKGTQFTRNFDQGLEKAVFETNMLFDPKPDFVVYGGDLAQLGKPEELDHGMEIMSELDSSLPVKWVIGEHDFYLDMGQYWQEHISPLYYSFEHKGVHFVVLNSILTKEDWINQWSTPMERMLNMARLDNPQGSPFMVGDPQLKWLEKDLSSVADDTPLVVLSHSPLYKIFKPWNFWTDDAEKVQKQLQRFDKVTVLHGHVHQVMYNQIGNISFYAMMSTAWPWPYPTTYIQKDSQVPKLTVKMNRADPFKERDATGWSIMTLSDGRMENQYQLWENDNRTVGFSAEKGTPVDKKYTPNTAPTPPQKHY